MKIYFASTNEYKLIETKEILEELLPELKRPQIIPCKQFEIEEIQNRDLKKIAREKTVRAFQKLRQPVMTDHTALTFPGNAGMPGGLTRMFWDALKGKRFCELFAQNGTKAIATTVIGYCDGRHVYTFQGEVEGEIVVPDKNLDGFQWDYVFKPDGSTKTYRQMTEQEKNSCSMRRQALEQFAGYLNGR